MDESRYDRLISSPFITFTSYTELASSSASYLEAPEPELVLRSGLVEETGEILATDPTDKDEFQKELGDIIWYISQIAKYKGLSLEQVANAGGGTFTTFSDFQTAHADTFTYSPDDTPHELLAISVLRVIDVLSPKMGELWQGADRPDLSIVLHELLCIIAQISNMHDIDLEKASRLALEKVRVRLRKPHVIRDQATLVSSGRERLTANPGVRHLLATLALKDSSEFTDLETS